MLTVLPMSVDETFIMSWYPLKSPQPVARPSAKASSVPPALTNPGMRKALYTQASVAGACGGDVQPTALAPATITGTRVTVALAYPAGGGEGGGFGGVWPVHSL